MNQTFTLRDRFRESTREAILDAAAQAVNKGGVGAVRMEDIAAGAGIAVGTLYNYFSDRRALVSALLQTRTQGLLDALDAAAATPAGEQAPTSEGVRAELREFVAAMVTHWDANRMLLTLLIEDVLQRGADATAVNRQATVATQLMARAERLMARGVEAGVLRPASASTYAAMLLGMVRGVAITAVVRSDAGFADRGDEIVRVFLNGASR